MRVFLAAPVGPFGGGEWHAMLLTDHDQPAFGSSGVAGGGLGSMRARDAWRLLWRGLLRVPRKARQPVAVGSAVQCLCLVLVSEREAHAYEIERRYQQHYGSLVPLPTRSVYRTLAVLEQRDQVQSIPVAGVPASRGLQPRVCYQITKAGEEAARLWVLSPVDGRRWRGELLARLDAAGILGMEALSELTARYEQYRLREQQEIIRQLEDLGESDLMLARGLALQERLAVLRTQAQWAASTRNKLQQRRR